MGISVDSPAQNAATVEKLRLPFPLLSDPEGTQAIRPYDVWHGGKSSAPRPGSGYSSTSVLIHPSWSMVTMRALQSVALRVSILWA